MRDRVPRRDFDRAVVYGDERGPVVVLVHIADHVHVHLGVLVQLRGGTNVFFVYGLAAEDVADLKVGRDCDCLPVQWV